MMNDHAAATILQSIGRVYLARKKFRSLLHAASWNILDNNQEQLNLQRAARTKSAGQMLSAMAQSKPSVETPQVAETAIPEDYTGPHVRWPMTMTNAMEILESFKDNQLLHHTYVAQIVGAAIEMFNDVPTLQEINVSSDEKITIVGDIHGQLQDLYSIFTINGLPSTRNKYLFNGDFVDRGVCGTEVMISMLCLKLVFPTGVYMNRGNHESRNQNSWMGFEEELWEKYDGRCEEDPSRADRIFQMFQQLFDSLPLCALVQEKIFVVHGGLSSRDGITLNHLRGISRRREPPLHQTGFEDRLFEDLLWSDPRNIQGRQQSERGAGVEFGYDVTNNFCAVNRVALIVRSHECVHEGFDVLHGGRLITLFSASRYCGTQNNKGAFLSLGEDLQPEIQQFFAHPMNKTELVAPPTEYENEIHLQEDILRMIIERICDHKPSLFWYYTQHDQVKAGKVSRLVWAEGLRHVLQLDILFLSFQKKLADVDSDNLVNYSKFLARYRIENPVVDNSGWQESVISTICKKLYKAMGAGSLQQAFSVFDTDANGYIEYNEFMAALKKMDTGLSEQHIYELMKSADSNEDGRIDFKEFVQRFDVIFTDINASSQREDDAMDVDADTMPPPAPTDVLRRRLSDQDKLVRRNSERDKALNPIPANVDAETMDALQQIGRALFAREEPLEQIFNEFDTNGDGVLQEIEFYAALDKFGLRTDPTLRQKIMQAVDTDQGNTIDYKEFFNAFSVHDRAEAEQIDSGHMTWQNSVLQQMTNVFYQHRIHIRSAFRLFDKDHSGTISKDEFRSGINMFNSLLNSPLTSEQIEQLLMHLDKNGDGELCYNEFFNGFRVVDTHSKEETI